MGNPFQVVMDYLQPLGLLWLGYGAVPSWLYLTFVELHPAKVLSAKNWADASFARLWWIVSPIATARNEQLARLMTSAEGVVVDIGTGYGGQLHYYRNVADSIKHIFFVEPNTTMHSLLSENARANGLQDKFSILTCGAEDMTIHLASHSIQLGQVDTIVSIMCLCGVPAVQNGVASTLYRLLGPGGKMIVWEHVLNRDSPTARIYQQILSVNWSMFMGGCRLMEPTDMYLREAGNWSSDGLKRVEGESLSSPVPFVGGILVKALTDVSDQPGITPGEKIS